MRNHPDAKVLATVAARPDEAGGPPPQVLRATGQPPGRLARPDASEVVASGAIEERQAGKDAYVHGSWDVAGLRLEPLQRCRSTPDNVRQLVTTESEKLPQVVHESDQKGSKRKSSPGWRPTSFKRSTFRNGRGGALRQVVREFD
jgi:hypothetical protein